MEDQKYDLEDKLAQNEHTLKEAKKRFEDSELAWQKELAKVKEQLVQAQKDNQEGKSTSQQ